LEHVSLAMDFARVDFIEERHHDESVEDDGEVLRWLGAQLLPAPRWDVQDSVTCKRILPRLQLYTITI
jgi:hypothetical protein